MCEKNDLILHFSVPKTVISPPFYKLCNIYPLIDDSTASLRAQVLLDYLVLEPVHIDDPRLDSFTGLTVKNLNGRELLFRNEIKGKHRSFWITLFLNLVRIDDPRLRLL